MRLMIQLRPATIFAPAGYPRRRKNGGHQAALGFRRKPLRTIATPANAAAM